MATWWPPVARHSLLVISEKARVHGKVKAGHVIINGEVLGPIQCDELLELQPKARVVGDVRYGSLEMHQGATIDGELRSLKADESPTLKLAASNDHLTPGSDADRSSTLHQRGMP